MNYTTIPSDEIIQQTADALTANGMTTIIVDTAAEAKAHIAQLVPQHSEVFAYTSVTLDDTGISEMINESGAYNSVRNTLNSMDSETQRSEMRKLGAAPDFGLGSAHAVTTDGKLIIASNTGSQLPAHAYGAGTMIWVVGAQKIVQNEAEGLKRLYEHVLPLESERAKIAYGVAGSQVSKVLTIHNEINPERAKVIIVKEALGY